MAGTALAKAYVQIVPSANGIQGSISNVLSGEADSAGKKAGQSIASRIKSTIAVAGIGKAIMSSINEGGKLQQSLGGIETLFKNSADTVKKYASEAYRTAGVSANGYMEQVTSFSAALISSLDGDTKKAAETANRAIIDMADNANKMGTPLESIQNAYQGFAKQNYTMLDNLKLGYGGTKTEMQRLLKDAQKLSGQKYDISNLSDVYNAIHVIQKELNITGTTSQEAATTLTGSAMAMKASFIDLLGNMALGKNIGPSLKNLADTTATFVSGNLMPMIGNVVIAIPNIVKEAINLMTTGGIDSLIGYAKGFVSQVPTLLSTSLDSVQTFASYLEQQSPIIVNKGFELLNQLADGIIAGLPVMIEKLPQIITTFANVINNNFPTIVLKGAELLKKLVIGIISAIPVLIANLPKIIEAIVSTLMAFQWMDLGKNIIKGFANGIKGMVSFVKEVARTVLEGIKSVFNSSSNVGVQLVKGIWNGISSVKDWILSKIRGFGQSIIKGLTDFFEIHSPSRRAEREVGKFIPKGVAVGIEANAKDVYDAMNDISKETLDIASQTLALNPSPATSEKTNLAELLIMIINILKIIADRDDQTIINVDDREVARVLREMGVVFA